MAAPIPPSPSGQPHTLLARVALFEGTYRKYHTELNGQASAVPSLPCKAAVTATDTLIAKGGFAIVNTGAGAEDFRKLFSSNNLDGNKEAIMIQKNDAKVGIANNTHTVLDWQWALSRSLTNDFLMKDGTPFTAQPNYDKKDFVQLFINRDPRLAETVMPPGLPTHPAVRPTSSSPILADCCR